MKNMEGYIKLHRQIIKWEWYDDANTFRLFIHLLIKANHADGNWRGYEIKRGQTFTSIGNLAHELSLSEKAIRIAIDKLIKTKEIVSKGASNGTMITVCNYDIYQINDKNEGQTKGQTKGERRANEGRQTRITKNDIEEKNNNEVDLSFVANNYIECFSKWLQFKKEIKDSYKSDLSVKTAYNNLLKLSGGNPQKANEIVNQSIGNNWKGLFELKTKGLFQSDEKETPDGMTWRNGQLVEKAKPQNYN